MNRLLIGTAVAVLLGLTPVLAPDESNMNPTQPGVSQETSKEAHQPPSGSGDQSAGAKEQSSAPPGSSASDTSNPTLGSESSKE
jgi:hypothetical protein